MAIKEFEFFHGAVLTKLMRSDKPMTLRLVETKPAEQWSTYVLNDAVNLFISHSKSSREVTRDGGGTSWPFNFSRNQLLQMQDKQREVWVALVCGSKKVAGNSMFICLLEPAQIQEIIDFSRDSQGITVRKPPRGRLRVFKGKQVRFYVPESRLDKWEVPG